MIPKRKIAGVIEISTGSMVFSERPPAFTGEAMALQVEFSLTDGGEPYSPSGHLDAELYFYWPVTVYMSETTHLTLDGPTLTGSIPAELMGRAGNPLMVVQLTDIDTSELIVAAAAPIQITEVRGISVLTSRAPTPSEIVYIGRAPYVDPASGNWMVWDNTLLEYADSGVFAQGDAKEEMEAAAASAAEAATSAANAAASATAAAGSATAARASEQDAADSATAAAGSASAARTSEVNAAGSASDASDSAAAAQTSAANAAASATAAAGSATAAHTSESNAAASATAAAGSATAAHTSEQNAADSATTAARSASAAQTSATNAASSATEAAGSAADALASETGAATSAAAAEASATAAEAAEDGAESALERIEEISAWEEYFHVGDDGVPYVIYYEEG